VIDVATLSVIRRWALREHLSLREIARRTGLSRNTIKKYLRAGEAEPRYAKRVSPSRLDPFAEKLAGWLKDRDRQVAQAAAHGQADARRPGRAGLRRLVQPRGGLRACLAGQAAGGRANHRPRHLRSLDLRRGRGVPVRLERGLGRHRRASGPSCRWPTPSSATAGPSSCGPTCCRHTRCCSMPTTTHSACWAVCLGGASTTT
jgi:transcriptional regulator with XRE-family HTH domain